MRTPELIKGLIFESATAPSLWLKALRAVADHAGHFGAAITSFDTVEGRMELLAGSENHLISLEKQQEYFEYWAPREPMRPILRSMPAGTICSDAEFLSDDFIRRDPYYQEYLAPVGMYRLGGRVFDNDERRYGTFAFLSTNRAIPAAEVALYNDLTDAIWGAMRIWQRLEDAQKRTDALSAAADHGPAFLIVSGGRRVHHMTANAARILERRPEIAITNGRIVVMDENRAAWVHALIKDAAAGASGGSAVLNRTAERRPLVLDIVPTGHRAEPSYIFSHTQGALVFLSDLAAPVPPSDHLWTIFEGLGLTNAEAQVAAMIARGAIVKDIARTRRTSVQTVRSQIRAILAKTGLKRIADLILLARAAR